MRRFRLIPIACLCILGLNSCRTQSKYHILGVDIKISVQDVSSGYIRAGFEPTRDAYYAIGCIPTDSEYDPENKPDQFMTLMVDSLYRNYLDWRYGYLKQQEDYIADFASHSLQYGSSEALFQGLSNDTSYWVYAFVVDPNTKSPYGGLFMQQVRTGTHESHSIWFDTRVQGSYLYFYPRQSAGGDIVENVPYTGGIVDSVSIVNRYPFPSDTSFLYSLNRYCDEIYSNASTYGILSQITYTGIRQINKSGELEEGTGYYIYMGELDGEIIERTYYRFVYDKTAWVQDISLYYRENFTSVATPEDSGSE